MTPSKFVIALVLVGCGAKHEDRSAAGSATADPWAGSAAPSPDPWGAGAAPAAPSPVATSPDFAFAPPSGFTRQGEWYVASRTENRGGGDEIASALVRVLPQVPATGNVGDAVVAAWRQYAPAELGAPGGMVYRRYVGDGAIANFVFTVARERGRRADTLFALYLIDCGAVWQPVVVAFTYDEPATTSEALIAMAARGSYPHAAALAEPALAAMHCGAGARRPLVDAKALAAHYYFGSSGAAEWVSLGTGATFMTAVTYGGELDLRPDGTFAYEFVGASGQVGAMDIATDAATGTWRTDEDLLVVTPSRGAERRYRVAGVTQLGATKAAVLLHDLTRPVNPLTVTDGGDLYVTK